MKLSELVRYLNCLDAEALPDANMICDSTLGELTRVVSEGRPELITRIRELTQDRAQMHAAIEAFRAHIMGTRQDVLGLIEGLQPGYFAESYRLHDEEIQGDSDQRILDRQHQLVEPVKRYLSSRISLHSDWHHAAMVIRPGRGTWLPLMVGNDPLYLVDIRPSLMTAAIDQFTPEYQRRLRPCTLRENDSNGMVLRDLPDGQFGFGLVMNFFEYKPFELIRLYFSDLYRKLRPGGVLALTFNNCDRWGGVELVERHFMCYTPGTMLIALAQSLGFEIQQQWDIDHAVTWLELRKPGTLTSLRGGQSLAKIVANH